MASAQRSRNRFDPNATTPFRLSRSKLDLFLECPRCFYLDRRGGVGRPASFPFTLNNAVDTLLKKEFDVYRLRQAVPPLCSDAGLALVPFQHPDLEAWRDSLRRGITARVPGTPFLLTGGIDDVWRDDDGKLFIVDYKATARAVPVTALDLPHHAHYKRQAEVYQWLFRANGFTVSDTAYFVYCTGDPTRDALDGSLAFHTALIPYVGDASWIEGIAQRAADCLRSAFPPIAAPQCPYCAYRSDARSLEG